MLVKCKECGHSYDSRKVIKVVYEFTGQIGITNSFQYAETPICPGHIFMPQSGNFEYYKDCRVFQKTTYYDDGTKHVN